MNNWLFSCLFLFSFSLSPLLSNEIPERIIKLEKIESILSLESSNGFVWEYSETKLPSHWLKIEIPSNPKNIFHKNFMRAFIKYKNIFCKNKNMK